jgi:hypothetical protein
MKFQFSILEFGVWIGWWICLLEIQLSEWQGSLLMIEKEECGRWQFEILYLRQLIINIRNWLIEE